MKRRVLLTASLLMMALVLAACGVNEPITAESEGFWNSFFCIPNVFF